MFHRKSKKVQKQAQKQAQEASIQNISLPVSINYGSFSASQPTYGSTFSASQPTYGSYNGLISPTLSGMNGLVSPNLTGLNGYGMTSPYNGAFSLSQPVNSPLLSPLTSPVMNPHYNKVGSPTHFVLNPSDSRMASPPPPPPHNNFSSILRSSSVNDSMLNRRMVSPPPRNRSDRTSRSIERPARSVSVRNQDFIYKSDASKNMGSMQRGRPLSRELDPRNPLFQGIGRSHSELAPSVNQRPPRERPVTPKSNANISFSSDRSHQSRYNEIKSRTAAGEYSILSDLSFANGERYNRKYGHGRNESSSSVTSNNLGSSYKPIPDPIKRPRSENNNSKATQFTRRGKSEPRRSSKHGYHNSETNLDFLDDYFKDAMKRSSKTTDSSYSTIEIKDDRQSITKGTKNNSVSKHYVEESPIINYNRNTFVNDSSIGRDFGIKIKNNKETKLNENNIRDNSKSSKVKPKPFSLNMDDFFSSLENEIDSTINSTFNTAQSLKANKLEDVVEVEEEDFTEPIIEDNVDPKKAKRISNDVLGLVLATNDKSQKSQPEIIIEDEEPDTEDEDEDDGRMYINQIISKSLPEDFSFSPKTWEDRYNLSIDNYLKKDNQDNKISIVVSDTENNEKSILKINTNPDILTKNETKDLLSATTIDEKPSKPLSPLGRSDSRNSNKKWSTDGKVSSPFTRFSQPVTPTSPFTGTFSENESTDIIVDGLSQDDVGNTSLGNISTASGKSGVLKSFLLSDIADIIENEQDVDTLNISPDYRDNFIEYLISQKYDDPKEDDFITTEGYYSWEEKTEKRPFVDVMAQLVDYRFSQEWVEEQEKKKKNIKSSTKASEDSSVEISIIVKVVKAEGLVASKDGKARNPYCEVKFDGNTFHTEKCENTHKPFWNQHLEIKAKNLTEAIDIAVWDKKTKDKKKIWKKDQGDEFLGHIKFSISDLINQFAREGYISKWYDLGKRQDKKDKYAGGKILIEASIGETADINEEKCLNKDNKDEVTDYDLLQTQLINCKVSFKHLFKILLKACLDHDLVFIHDDIDSNSMTSEILSDEAKILLKVFSKQWLLSNSFLVISYLEEAFEMYVSNRIPIHVVVSTFDVLCDNMKNDGWLPVYEKPHMIDLFEKMVAYHSRQVCHYREYFPKGEPNGVLASAIYLWRAIFKSKVYRDNHPELPISFREEIRTQITEHVENRYTKLLGLSSPFVENTEDILIGLAKLADLIVEDIEDDLNYYQDVFKKTVNIVRISSQIYLRNFIKELENNSDRLASQEALDSSKATFELYRRVRLMDRQYATLIPSLKRISMGSGFNVEKWFNDFVIAWLKVQQERTLEWVKTAIATDTLEKTSDTQPYSTSVLDLFEIMFEELDLIKGLEWSNSEQYNEFLTAFARIVTRAIEQYCDAMEKNEMKKEEINVAMKRPIDIANKSCVKLSNIEKSTEKLNELFNKIKELNIIDDTTETNTNSRLFTEEITGTFRIETIYAENLKPCNKNGLSNPYVVIKIPGQDKRNGNELVKTSIINDSLNPRWDETFQVSIVPTKTLEVIVYNKTSFLSSDAIIGKKNIHFSSRWCDHQTHELIVKLEPQGRLLIRITMDGEGENLSFFFKKSKQRLLRTSNDFVRELVYRITPYIKDTFTKIIKKNDSQNNVQLANVYTYNVVPLTISGRIANKPISQDEIDKELQPITDYLNKNLETLCNNLSTKMAQKVIIEIWCEVLSMLETSMIPQLYGAIERDRKFLNIRQVSIVKSSLEVFFDFFHSDGDELGIPKSKLLEYPVYDEIKLISRDYHLKISELIEKYEQTKKIYILRILRIHGQTYDSKILREKASKFVNKELENIN
ncbi:hypothetical protein BCR36DRAFT_40220 [Piromyces finnis]|uniref:C2 domain-containing protein n=1 Tax=Piromyces finnis TaxID=1754191 RepID=A0A1Y1VAP5_9FUNG|nr:hypothetical protein BCR36DRAFT_40220 [Piromyces finnis]|eukprot:ORX51376.1 hypothetical protein BCR36DRAFT_40220 [Piromyces finnis]